VAPAGLSRRSWGPGSAGAGQEVRAFLAPSLSGRGRRTGLGSMGVGGGGALTALNSQVFGHQSWFKGGGIRESDRQVVSFKNSRKGNLWDQLP